MRLDDCCLVEQDGGRKILRTRAGLGCGLEVVLPGGLWTNVPVIETFAQALAVRPAPSRRRVLLNSMTRRRHRAVSFPLGRVVRPDDLYRQADDARSAPSRAPTSASTRRRSASTGPRSRRSSNCKFCSVGLNLGIDDADEKSVNEVMEVVRAARARVRASPTSTSTPATTRATPTSTSSNRSSGASRRRPGCWSACRRRRTRTCRATTRCARWASTACPSASRSSTPRLQGRLPGQGPPSTACSATSTRSSTAPGSARRARGRALGHQRRDHRRPRAAGVVDPRHRLDHVGGRDPHGVRVPAAGRHRLRRHAAPPQTGDADPGLQAPVRGVHGARPAGRRGARTST